MIYFAPEALEEYSKLGITHHRMGYFSSRSAAMGAVPAEVVIATFFNFNPALIRKSIPQAWEARADPFACARPTTLPNRPPLLSPPSRAAFGRGRSPQGARHAAAQGFRHIPQTVGVRCTEFGV